MDLYQSIVAYDGTDFAGFQRQAGGQRTVQGELEKALRDLGWSGQSLLAAGRTDAGVHATGQVIAYRLDWRHSPQDLTRALNAHLPADVAVWDTRPAPEGFHPRFSARSRRYLYRVVVAPWRHPLRERYAWRVWPAPKVEAMNQVAGALVGRHDFGAFGTAPIPGGHTRRTVYMARWEVEGDELAFRIEADAFLYRMVRRLVAACLAVGSGRAAAEDVVSLLDRPERRWEGPLAPPQGLCLALVRYEGDDEGPESKPSIRDDLEDRGAENLLSETG